MNSLPILQILPALKAALISHPVVILQAPPGAGKSTVLPLELMNESWMEGGRIVMMEPRRLAARSVAMRMASTVEEKIAERVGYRIRFDTQVSSHTVIEVVTEGILTRMIQSDPSLEGIKLLIFDEFHERNLHADVALALSVQVQQLMRPDLRLLIMSATLDAGKLSETFGGAPVITSEGRQYPVELKYLDREGDAPVSMKTTTAIQRALKECDGDILVFLPGAGEIRQTEQKLEEKQLGVVICPLYGDLSFQSQQEAILPRSDGRRKVVLATSIAETSLTIEGVKVVIDAGLSRVPKFDPRSGLTRLETIRLTRDSADQRAGRAGRLAPGVCYRLWTEATQRNLVAQRTPEIVEADLASMMLDLFQWGIKDVEELTWVTPPPSGAVKQATELLRQLEAIDEQGITVRGKQMQLLPTHPRIAHMLLTATETKEKRKAADLAALLEERDPLPKDAGADISLRMETLDKWRSGERTIADRQGLERIEKLSGQWRRLLRVEDRERLDVTKFSDVSIGRLLMAAYPERIAKQQQRHSVYYTLANGRVLKLPDHDPLINESWLCVAQLDAGTKGEGKIFLAAALGEDDVKTVAIEKEVVGWDEGRQMVWEARERRIGVLLLDSRPVKTMDDLRRAEVWIELIRRKGLELLGWDEESRSCQHRMICLSIWRPNEGWPDASEEHLMATLDKWLPPFVQDLYKLQEIQKISVTEMLRSMLSWEQQQKLEQLAPGKLQVPSGSLIRVVYSPHGDAPIMEVRLQEVFGWVDTPAVNDGRNRIIMHLLSPGYKPVQVTQDLRSFWQNTYHEVRKELKRRYPKHSWPEDPWTAVAVRGVRKKG